MCHSLKIRLHYQQGYLLCLLWCCLSVLWHFSSTA